MFRWVIAKGEHLWFQIVRSTHLLCLVGGGVLGLCWLSMSDVFKGIKYEIKNYWVVRSLVHHSL